MNTKELFEKIQKDEELQKKFAGVTTPEKFYEVASANGLTDDIETMKQEAYNYLKGSSEISEKDLESLKQISAGVDGDSILENVVEDLLLIPLMAF